MLTFSLTKAYGTTSAPQNITRSQLGNLPGSSASPLTTEIHFFNSVLEGTQIPTLRILDSAGQVIEGAQVPEVSIRRSESQMGGV